MSNNTISIQKIKNVMKKHDKEYFTILSKEVNDIDKYVEKLHQYSKIIVEKVSKEIVGIAAIYINEKPPKNAYISQLFVIPSHRGKGIGRRLVLKAIKEAKKRYFERIYIEVFKSNKIAKRMYGKIGFKYCEDRKYKILMKLEIGINK